MSKGAGIAKQDFFDQKWKLEDLQMEDRYCLAGALFPEAIKIGSESI